MLKVLQKDRHLPKSYTLPVWMHKAIARAAREERISATAWVENKLERSLRKGEERG